ncbi:ski oncogene [Nilaparvata lugens]|uniref:ski oncogene n=1 Tax=Nilaparvata lugens TaxID=108931 RepID=UPI00193D0E80|nr:ski oncogene [Nilaparvata lugens]
MSLTSLSKTASSGLPLALDRVNSHQNNNNNDIQLNNNNNNKELQIRQHHLTHNTSKSNQVGTVVLYGVPIVSLVIDQTERLCLAQISNTLLKAFSYNEIHNRRVALGITCVQCTPVQLEILRRAGAMPVSSRRCGMITRREAERLCKSFLGDNSPPRLPDDFAFAVHHECAWGCRGSFLPSRYNSSRAKCIKCSICGLFFSPNKFIFHSHRSGPTARYVQPDAANFNSWRRHMRLSGSPPEEIVHAWEDVKVKAMFNGGTRKRLLSTPAGSALTSQSPAQGSKASPPHHIMVTPSSGPIHQKAAHGDVIMGHQGAPPPPFPLGAAPSRVPSLPLVMDYVWHHAGIYSGIKPYCLPWLTPSPLLIPPPPPAPTAVNMTTSINSNHVSQPDKQAGHHQHHHTSAFRPVFTSASISPPTRFHIGDTSLSNTLPPPPLSRTQFADHVKPSPLERSPLSSPSRSRSDRDDEDEFMEDETHTKIVPEVATSVGCDGGGNEEGDKRMEEAGGADEAGQRGDEENEDEETVDIETCPEDELKPNPFWAHDNEKKYQTLLQGPELAEKQDDVNSDLDRKYPPPFSWPESVLYPERRSQLSRPYPHNVRETLISLVFAETLISLVFAETLPV